MNNPRDENPSNIRTDIKKGLEELRYMNFQIERKQFMKLLKILILESYY
jgi:UDP-N-acetylmuramyl tripeptide synthase